MWPENWLPWRLFSDLATQWRVGLGGATGLDYGPLIHLLDRERLDAAEWRETFDCLRALEGAALEQMRANSAD